MEVSPAADEVERRLDLQSTGVEPREGDPVHDLPQPSVEVKDDLRVCALVCGPEHDAVVLGCL